MERETDHSSPSAADGTNGWTYTFTSSRVYRVWCLIKRRDDLAPFLPKDNNWVLHELSLKKIYFVLKDY
jgi:hypothetical protein